MKFNGIMIVTIVLSLLLCLVTLEIPYLLGGVVIAFIGLFFFKMTYEKALYVMFLLLVFSAFFGPYASIPGFENLFLFRFLLIGHLFLFLFSRKDFAHLKSMKIPLMLMVLWFSYSLLTIVWAKDTSLGFVALYYQFESMYLIFLCAYYCSNLKRFKQLSRVILAGYVSSLALGLYEVWTGNHGQFSAESYLNYTDHRPTGFMMNLNDYASFIVIFLAISLYAIPKANKYIY